MDDAEYGGSSRRRLSRPAGRRGKDSLPAREGGLTSGRSGLSFEQLFEMSKAKKTLLSDDHAVALADLSRCVRASPTRLRIAVSCLRAPLAVSGIASAGSALRGRWC